MYCPVDGDEFREGITRCPEHDVDLVEDPPDLELPSSWTDRFDDRTAVRVSFWVFVAVATVYALTGLITAVILLLTELWEWEAFDTAVLFQRIQSAMFPVGIGVLGILVGALVVRTYLALPAPPDNAPLSPPRGSEGAPHGPMSDGLVRFLFALTLIFALLWVVTGIAIAQEQAEFQLSSPVFGGEQEEPSNSFITLSALHYVAYVTGVASLSVMGAGLVVRTYVRGGKSTRKEEQ